MATNYSKAFSLAPTGNWDGNDGPWSTFMVRVGTPAQLFRVLPATNGLETWIPMPDQCSRGMGWCGNARGVEPFNGASASPSSGSPNETATTTVDAGLTCTANRSPSCHDCVSVNGQCTNGPCTGRFCCGDPAGDCSSQPCSGFNGICTGSYIGCPCVGADFNAGPSTESSAGLLNPSTASGFQSNQSSSWIATGTRQLSSEQYLGISGNGQFGTDAVGLGVDASTGLTLPVSVVAGVTTEPFYMGTLGLKPENSSASSGSPASLISQLKLQNLIPSLAYGYTAGAIYKQPPSLGSLTLGGYDSARMVPKDLSFPLAGNDSQSLVVQLQSITASNTLISDVSLLSDSVSAMIDTTPPFIWLPLSACLIFEEAFGLTWNSSKELYLVNDTAHQQLQNNNPIISFTLGTTTPGSDSVNITLPYCAFDLQAASPVFPNGTNYFPLRRAANEAQYTLGRVFLQEAYLLVDYEQSNFFVSQAEFPLNTSPDIVTIDHSLQNSPAVTLASNGHSSLSKGAIAGIAIGSIISAMLLSTLAFVLIRHFRGRKLRDQPSSPGEEEKIWPSSPGGSDGTASVPQTLQAIVTTDSTSTGQNAEHTRGLDSTIASSHRTPTQELPGSATSKELSQTPPGSLSRKPKHIAELANEW